MTERVSAVSRRSSIMMPETGSGGDHSRALGRWPKAISLDYFKQHHGGKLLRLA